MIKNIISHKNNSIENEIELVVTHMTTLSKSSEEYTAMARNLELLCKANTLYKEGALSKDVVANVGGNLIGILSIILFEGASNVISSKALGFVMRPRI